MTKLQKKKIETRVSEKFRLKFKMYIAVTPDISSALENAREDAAEFVPFGMYGTFDDENLTFRLDDEA